MNPDRPLEELFNREEIEGGDDGIVVINERCRVQTQDGYRVVLVSALPLAYYSLGDRAGQAHAMVSLVEQGWARQTEVASAFGCDVRTVRHNLRRFKAGGLSALGRSDGCPKGAVRLPGSRAKLLNDWKAKGVSNREIARRLGISEMAVRKSLRRLGWKDRPPEQSTLPGLDRSANPNLSGFQSPEQAEEIANAHENADGEASAAPQNANPNLSGFENERARPGRALCPLAGHRSGRPQRRSSDGLSGTARRCRASIRLRRPGQRSRRAPGYPLPDPKRDLRDRRRDLRLDRSGLLRPAHDPADLPFDGPLAHQTPRGHEGTLSRRIGPHAQTRPRSRGENLARKTRRSGRVRFRSRLRPGARPVPGGHPWQGDRFPLRRRPRARLPRQATPAQGSRGAKSWRCRRHPPRPQPRAQKINAQLRKAYAELNTIAAKYGLEAFADTESDRRTMRGFKTANAALGLRIEKAFERINALKKKRSKMPTRIPVRDATPGEVVKLRTERKHLTDLFKMVAYQAEIDLTGMIAPHYRRAEDEGHILIHSILAGAGDIAATNEELRVTLEPLSSPHRIQALKLLCETLNETQTRFPDPQSFLWGLSTPLLAKSPQSIIFWFFFAFRG